MIQADAKKTAVISMSSPDYSKPKLNNTTWSIDKKFLILLFKKNDKQFLIKMFFLCYSVFHVEF